MYAPCLQHIIKYQLHINIFAYLPSFLINCILFRSTISNRLSFCYNFRYVLDLDIDSQTDGANAVMSGIDSESESDIADGPDTEDAFPESQYTHSCEEEFGAVRCFYSIFIHF